jgi:hypothetical protein
MKISGLSVLDDLNFSSREFYELSKLKLSVSLMLFSSFFIMLGLTCQYGGKSYYSHTTLDVIDLTGDFLSFLFYLYY